MVFIKIHRIFNFNIWKISGGLFFTIFCMMAVIGDLVLRWISGQGFMVNDKSEFWMALVIVIIMLSGTGMGDIL